MSDRWIVVPRWEEFQHYKDRDPTWIKNYCRLLSDDGYLELTGHQRGVLHGLWMAYASGAQALPDSTLTITRRLGLKVSRATLDSLNHAGFIEFSASKPLATRYQAASPEKEKEKEKDLPKKVSRAKPVDNSPRSANVQPKDPVKAIEAMIQNGVIQDPVDLEAELAGYRLNSTVADRLRGMLE